jgi:translation initiation factor IF-3
MKSALPVQKDGPRINEEIRVREVQLIDAGGHNHGNTPIQTALEMAQSAGLDLVEIKEIKLRPMIDDHDYQVKMRSMKRFFEEGDKVKITLRFRGREMAHQELGTKLLDRVKDDVGPVAKVEQEPKFEGRQMIMVLAPR